MCNQEELMAYLDGEAPAGVAEHLKECGDCQTLAAELRGVSARLLERTAQLIERAQRRNACARRCHTKRTRRLLRSMGIKLTQTPVCKWDSS